MADIGFVADFSGALFWEEQSLLVVSDLHLEKGSSFAARGVLLPPYDTVATLSRLAAVIARHDPRQVIALGDSFHDREAHARLSEPDREALSALQFRRNWIWIAGNHDPALPTNLGGVVATEVAIGPIVFRHEPTGASGEIAGHLHPKARVPTRGRSIERRCFAVRRRARGDAGVRRLHRRPRASAIGRSRGFSDRRVSWPTCSATTESTHSQRHGVIDG